MVPNIVLSIFLIFAFVYIIYDSRKVVNLENDTNNESKSKKHENQKNIIYDLDKTLLWEEEYLMIEIIPESNYNLLTDKNTSKGKSIVSYDGIKTESLKIDIEEIAIFLKKVGINKYKKILYLGASSYPEEIKNHNTIAYGCLGDTIFIEYKNNIVEKIWFVSNNKDLNLNPSIVNALNQIGLKYNLILVDYYPITKKIVNLKNLIEVESYLTLIKRIN